MGVVSGGPTPAGGMGENVGPVLATGGPTMPPYGVSFGQMKTRSPVGSIRGSRHPAQPLAPATATRQTPSAQIRPAVFGFLPGIMTWLGTGPQAAGWAHAGRIAAAPAAQICSPETTMWGKLNGRR
jgi:hypothetical protein